MSNQSRPPIRIHFEFNLDTGAMEFIVDDDSPDRSEDYHDQVAGAIARLLSNNPAIADAGPIRYRLDQQWYTYDQTQQNQNRDTLTD